MNRTTASRLAWIVAALAAACGGATVETRSAPLDQLYRPTGLAVHRAAGMTAGRLIVASSNGDLLYDDDSGGSLLAIDPSGEPAALTGAIQARSFAGELVVADPEVCGLAEPVALFATRGSNVLYAARIGAAGELSCEDCDVPLAGSFSDPFAVVVACAGGRARAFVGYLSSFTGEGWISELDLAPLRDGLPPSVIGSMPVGAGTVSGLAYDDRRDRLYLLGLATASPTPLRWIDLAGCTVGAGGCTVGQAFVPGITTGIELRSMALAHPFTDPGADPNVRRAYLIGGIYDSVAATTAGGRTDDLGGRLLVVDLVDNARGEVSLRLAREPLAIGRGAQQVRVLPQRGDGRRDLVAALTIDEGVLTLYDDDTGALVVFGRNPVTGDPVVGGRDPFTGAPVLGGDPFGLAVDPELVGTVARVYVASYEESWVTPIDVPLDAPENARFTGAGGAAVRISGGAP